MDSVAAFIGVLDNRVACTDYVSIVTQTSCQQVNCAVAGEYIIQCIASAVDGGNANQGKVLDISRKRVRCRALYGICAFVCILGHHVCGVIDDVSIIAQSAHHRINTCTAVKCVAKCITG